MTVIQRQVLSVALVRDVRRLPAGPGRVLLVVPVVLGATVLGVGWLYVLRGLGWFSAGPDVRDSLPLLQLAGLDGQPLLRVLVAWLPCGALAGLLTLRTRWPWRALLTAVVGVAVLLLASQASFALARNLKLSGVLWSRVPGTGPWLEGISLAVGAVLPGIWRAGRRGLGGTG
jgi:hypothetical protein